MKLKRRDIFDADHREVRGGVDEISEGFKLLWTKYMSNDFGAKSFKDTEEGKAFSWEEVQAEQPSTEDPLEREDVEEAPSASLSVEQAATRKSKPAPRNPWDDYDASDDVYAEHNLGRPPTVSDHCDRAVTHLEGHVESYHYRLEEDVNGKLVDHVVIDGHAYELIVVDQNMLISDTKRFWFRQEVKDNLTKFSKVLRGRSDKFEKLNFDSNVFLDLEDFAAAYLQDCRAQDRRLSMEDIIAAVQKDKKGRMEVLCAAGLQIASRQGLAYWPFKIRCVQGHNEGALANADPFALATLVYCSPYLSVEDRAAFAGKPCCDELEKIPSVLYHRTAPGRWKSILDYGFIPGGGPRVNTGRAHNYFATHTVDQADYVSGLRRLNTVQITVDARAAVSQDNIVFMKTSSDGILTESVVRPEHIISVLDTESGEYLWTKPRAAKKAPLDVSVEERVKAIEEGKAAPAYPYKSLPAEPPSATPRSQPKEASTASSSSAKPPEPKEKPPKPTRPAPRPPKRDPYELPGSPRLKPEAEARLKAKKETAEPSVPASVATEPKVEPKAEVKIDKTKIKEDPGKQQPKTPPKTKEPPKPRPLDPSVPKPPSSKPSSAKGPAVPPPVAKSLHASGPPPKADSTATTIPPATGTFSGYGRSDAAATLTGMPTTSSVESEELKCPDCGAGTVEGQLICDVCGKRFVETTTAKRKKMGVKRQELVDKLGIRFNLSADNLRRLSQDQMEELNLVQETQGRGTQSPESSLLETARKRHNRSKEFGFHSLLKVFQNVT